MNTPESFRRRRVLALGAGSALLGLAGTARAQKYPERYIRIVSVTSPGVPLDDYSRKMAKFLDPKLGQAVVIENRPGASMIIASDHVAKSAPDGYTLLLASSSAMSANPFLFKQLPYNPGKDFAPVARLMSIALVLLVPASSPHKTVADLVAAARVKPGALNAGSVSTGYRIMLSAFNKAAGIESLDVPYKSAGNLYIDLIAGLVDYSILEYSSAIPHIQSGKVRALAVLSPERMSQTPKVPTLAETGLQDVAMVDAFARINWIGLFAPAGTPAPIVQKLEQLSLEFARSPLAKEHHAMHGSVGNPGTGAELGKAIVADQELWRKMIAASGIKPE